MANSTISVLPQRHHGGSVGLRIGKFAYITDTEPEDKHSRFISGCDLVFVDTMHDRHDYQSLNLKNNQRAEHGWSIGNGELAFQSGIKQLGLIHIDPFYNDSRIRNLLSEAKEKFPNVIIPQEGTLYRVNE